MKHSILYSTLAGVALALFTGCGGDDAAKVSAANEKAFASAPDPVQQAWRTALAASQTNGYVVAVSTLRDLAGQPLSLEQVEAVQTAMRAINAKLTAAVGSGDAAAVKAMEEIKASAVRR